MKTIKHILRAGFAALFVALLFAVPAKAQFVMGNVGAAGNIISSGTPGQVVTQTNYYAAYLTGTAYTFTGSAAAITGGTTSPSITLPAAGTYFLYGDIDTNYVGATFAANQTLTLELYRTNNTPGVISSSPAVVTLNVVTTFTGTASTSNIHGVIYTTINSNDVITLYGLLSATPSAGSVTATGGGLYALRLY